MKGYIVCLLLLFITSAGLSQNTKQPKNYISIGFLDHKTGNSIIGYTKNIFQNQNNEIFIGFGTMLASNTFVVGLKKYLFRFFFDGYSTISMQQIYGMGGDGIRTPAISIGVEKRIWKIFFINLGVNSTIMDFGSIDNLDVNILPNLNLSLRF